jgi:calcium-activated chloride channel regulator 4
MKGYQMSLFRKKLKQNFFSMSILGTLALSTLSYSQIENLSRVRDAGSAGTEEVLDLTISLYRPWSEMTDSLRIQYEQAIRYWANGIYEMTNGGQILGKIRIFTDGHFVNSADVQWLDTLRPNANLNGFLSNSSRRIQFADTFYFRIPGTDWDWQGAGYTLAHESGHYIYSSFDEYDLQTGDIPVVPAIMNNQWYARGGNFEWLNFSTSNNIGDVTKTMQGRYYGCSGWTMLTQNPASDSSKVLSYTGTTRAQYPVLNSLAPTASNTYFSNGGTTYSWMRVDLPATHAQDSLQIIWMGNTIDIDLVLDKSGSMSGTPLANVQSAAKAFVDVIYNFATNFELTSSLGLTAFCTAPDDPPTYPITLLTSSNIDSIKNIIDTLSSSGLTAMYDACLVSLSKLTAYSSTNSTRLCMLLTDGAENNSTESDVNNVVSPFVQDNIPIYTFGYGDGASHDNCKALSTGTNGSFYANLTDPAEVVDEWLRIFDDAADLQYTKDATFSSIAGLNFTIDPTVYSGIVMVTYTLNDTSSFCSFTIEDNRGTQVSSTVQTIALNSAYPRKEIALISIDSSAIGNAQSGSWKCNVTSSGLASSELEGTVRVKGKSGGTYSLTIANTQNGFYSSPEPLHLSVSLGKKGNITGLNVAATLTSPSGVVSNIALNDSGANGDKIAHDGIYSLDYSNYTENGQYKFSVHFDNAAGNAYYSIDGVQYSRPENDTILPHDTVYVTDNFSREKYSVIHVSDVDTTDTTGLIMGFENDSLWSIIYSSGVLSSSAIRTQGTASLQIAGNGWQQIKSHDINTADLQNVSDTVSLDLFLGNTQTNPYWTGQVQLFVNCPSANIYNQYVGLVNLTGLPLDQFSTLSFVLPQSIVSVLNGSYSDFSFSVSINTNAGTGAYYFDNMRFGN